MLRSSEAPASGLRVGRGLTRQETRRGRGGGAAQPPVAPRAQHRTLSRCLSPGQRDWSSQVPEAEAASPGTGCMGPLSRVCAWASFLSCFIH